jgi:hypothetical protein
MCHDGETALARRVLDVPIEGARTLAHRAQTDAAAREKIVRKNL